MWMFVLLALGLGTGLFYVGRAWLGWVAPGACLLLGWWQTGVESSFLFVLCGGVIAIFAAITGIPPLRREILTKGILPRIAPILPRMSETERIAIEAGSVWWEAEFFTGKPNWRRLLNFHPKELTPRERAFVDGPCEQLCTLVDEWKDSQRGDLSKEAWDFIKSEGFMGMIIPEEYGGLGFGAAAHSAVVTKLSSRSIGASVTVMVPNSLGPAELILHYGTKEQKDHYLPRLARGEDVPCFALTEPSAGSDAGSMTSKGVICKGTFEGKQVLGMRLDWDKRYITLAPVATVLGLAFKLSDPEHLLGEQEDLGITCALIPADLPGVEVGERHDPLGIPFMNGPTFGKDVFVPLDFIIGGKEQAGQGWMMLMQSLSAGRGISLPSMSSGAAQLATRTTGAYATVRKQFNTPIGRFEGIEAPLARIGGLTYAMEAARRLTAGAVDDGEKPAVASAVVKCYMTEGMRTVTNDAMDIVGGAGICLGPRNILGGAYAALPIGITVEGANILTRSMIIFGQGAIRCHPFVQDEMKGAHEKDLALFDRSFFGHIGFVFSNMTRTLVLGMTNGAFTGVPVSGPHAVHYRRLTRLSAAFALTADLAMGTLGGALKRKEAITGRLSDVLAAMYLSSAALKRYHDEGSKEQDLPYLQWFCETAQYEAQQALHGVFQNLPLRPAAWLLRTLVFPFGRRAAPPNDRLVHQAAKGLLDGGSARERLTGSIYLPQKDELGLGQLEETLAKIVRAQPAQAKIRAAVKAKELERKPLATQSTRALEAKIISAEEADLIAEAKEARQLAVAVDSFSRRMYAELSA